MHLGLEKLIVKYVHSPIIVVKIRWKGLEIVQSGNILYAHKLHSYVFNSHEQLDPRILGFKSALETNFSKYFVS